jgi:hypothetical protein
VYRPTGLASTATIIIYFLYFLFSSLVDILVNQTVLNFMWTTFKSVNFGMFFGKNRPLLKKKLAPTATIIIYLLSFLFSFLVDILLNQTVFITTVYRTPSNRVILTCFFLDKKKWPLLTKTPFQACVFF